MMSPVFHLSLLIYALISTKAVFYKWSHIQFLDSLNINLCFMKDKKIVWHKDFKNNDPFLKN